LAGRRTFFFYGTLLAGSDNPVARSVHERLGPGRPGVISGELFAIEDAGGWYPALRPGDGAVRGMVHAVAAGFGDTDLAALDAYEGDYYRRAAVEVRCGDERVEAEAWLWRGALPDGVRPVADGDFVAFLTREGLRGYCPRD